MAHKYSKEVCTRDHTGDIPQAVLETLPVNQGHPVRHRCAACAYEAGKLATIQEVEQLAGHVGQQGQESQRLRQGDVPGRDGRCLLEEDDLDEGVDWAPNLVDSYPDTEFKNLTRSTVALLAYWREPKAVIRALAEQLDAPDLVDAIITPEFPTPSPGGKASFTDLMLESTRTVVGIEAKRAERRYPLVGSWCASENRRRVLNHWLSLIQPRTTMTVDARVESLVYQMVHRTASVCARPAARAIVLYQLFGSAHVAEYEHDLRTLVEVIRPNSGLEVWLHVVPTEERSNYATIANKLPTLAPAEAAATIRRAIANGELFRFSDAAPRQITTVTRY